MSYEKEEDKTKKGGPIVSIDDTFEAVLPKKDYHLSPIPAVPISMNNNLPVGYQPRPIPTLSVLAKNSDDAYLEQRIQGSINHLSESLKVEYIEFFKMVDILKSCLQNAKAVDTIKVDAAPKETKKGKKKVKILKHSY